MQFSCDDHMQMLVALVQHLKKVSEQLPDRSAERSNHVHFIPSGIFDTEPSKTHVVAIEILVADALNNNDDLTAYIEFSALRESQPIHTFKGNRLRLYRGTMPPNPGDFSPDLREQLETQGVKWAGIRPMFDEQFDIQLPREISSRRTEAVEYAAQQLSRVLYEFFHEYAVPAPQTLSQLLTR